MICGVIPDKKKNKIAQDLRRRDEQFLFLHQISLHWFHFYFQLNVLQTNTHMYIIYWYYSQTEAIEQHYMCIRVITKTHHGSAADVRLTQAVWISVCVSVTVL